MAPSLNTRIAATSFFRASRRRSQTARCKWYLDHLAKVRLTCSSLYEDNKTVIPYDYIRGTGGSTETPDLPLGVREAEYFSVRLVRIHGTGLGQEIESSRRGRWSALVLLSDSEVPEVDHYGIIIERRQDLI
ncbi:hypothetical protein DTO164E3_992 [Paecilomyces variotii]|nr:hypothetical protein DTO164E3_992 [Paecilomyces variotii]